MLDHPWDYFPDGIVPDAPPLILQPEAIAGAAQTFPNSPQDCVGGAISGITDELVWSILLGPAGPVDLTMAAFIGCMVGGSGRGGGDPPGRSNLTSSEEAAREALGLSKREFGKAIHKIKQQVEGNPDMLIDKMTGDVYDARSMEWVGNLYDEAK